MAATLNPADASDSLTLDEATFLELVTVDSLSDAAATYARHGVVRLPAFLDASESAALDEAADSAGILSNAFGQSSQQDRYTRWLAGDNIAGGEDVAVEMPDAIARRAYLDESGWRAIAAQRGYGHLALAEVVSSLPGGREQRWHFDGEGVTAQIALVPIGLAQGPTEVAPRALPDWYVREWEAVGSAMASGAPPLQLMAEVLPKLGELAKMPPARLLHDATSALHGAAWAALRPPLQALASVDAEASRRLARQIVENGLTPGVVRLTADVGCLTLYDSALVHRGGRNVGATRRPILAVHLRSGDEYGPGAAGNGLGDSGWLGMS